MKTNIRSSLWTRPASTWQNMPPWKGCGWEKGNCRCSRPEGANIIMYAAISADGLQLHRAVIGPYKTAHRAVIGPYNTARKAAIGPYNKARKAVIGSYNTACLISFLEQLYERLSAAREQERQNLPTFVKVWDKVAFHHSHQVTGWCTAHPRMMSLFLPPYSLLLNPIEECFSAWK